MDKSMLTAFKRGTREVDFGMALQATIAVLPNGEITTSGSEEALIRYTAQAMQQAREQALEEVAQQHEQFICIHSTNRGWVVEPRNKSDHIDRIDTAWASHIRALKNKGA